MIICTVLDIVSESFSPVMQFKSTGEAVRSFTASVNQPDKDSVLYMHPQDFRLLHIANISDSAEVVPLDPHYVLASGDTVAIRT